MKCFSSHWEIDVFKEEEEARSVEKWEEINHWLSENTLFTAAYFSNLRFHTPYFYNWLNFLCLDILKAWLQDGNLSKAYHLPNDTIKEFPANQENISYENIWMQFIWGQTLFQASHFKCWYNSCLLHFEYNLWRPLALNNLVPPVKELTIYHGSKL